MEYIKDRIISCSHSAQKEYVKNFIFKMNCYVTECLFVVYVIKITYLFFYTSIFCKNSEVIKRS